MARLAPLLVLVLAACAYTGGGWDDPIARKLSWYSYLDGDDIRAACRPGGAERFRFVYNAVYIEQVRAYDVSVDPASGAGTLHIRVLTQPDLRRIPLTGARSVLEPWQPREALRDRGPDEVRALRAAMAASGVFEGAPTGLELASEDFYWIAVACTGGRVHFNAYRWPSPRFAGLTFPDFLFARDPTGVPVNSPRAVDANWLYGEPTGDLRNANRFALRVGENGLSGLGPLF
jgi:hypothetical protein